MEPAPDRRPTYADLMTAVDMLMLAHTTEVQGGRTEELRAKTVAAYAEVARLMRVVGEPVPGPAVPEDDPLLPIRRGIERAPRY